MKFTKVDRTYLIGLVQMELTNQDAFDPHDIDENPEHPARKRFDKELKFKRELYMKLRMWDGKGE